MGRGVWGFANPASPYTHTNMHKTQNPKPKTQTHASHQLHTHVSCSNSPTCDEQVDHHRHHQ